MKCFWWCNYSFKRIRANINRKRLWTGRKSSYVWNTISCCRNIYCKINWKGYKVAICEQLEDPKQAKGIVKRDVIRVVTPGTVMESNLLEEKKTII